ncbi:BatA domain-containing protein [Dyadobacter sp. CY343]|uniref:BatA domain-containing protein n=1 Tax=Dyadobacter sp. CY343 TaxID=2907299 RepID=UPI001F315EA9|nr:BatA domain-containing protein [Dyadobacter sp. CY343]MCE7062010.1 BatA domain-containing protein [Dyadobacter sp. CY343]
MELLQPWMLWGAAGIVLPFAIHFWYQKKGKVLEWAASRWLFEKTSLKHRGVRLHEILLLLVRCALILLLTLILSQPIFNFRENSMADKTVHIVEPNAAVVNEYRFELENALRKGEKVVWVDKQAVEMERIGNIPKVNNPAQYLQNTINHIPAAGVSFKIYLASKQGLLDQPKIYVPGAFDLYPAFDSTDRRPLRYLLNSEGEKLAVHPQTGILEVFGSEPAGYRFASAPAHSGPVYVLVKFKNSLERQTVTAAIEALETVYKIPFDIDESENADRKYDWILADQLPATINPQSIYLISGKPEPIQKRNNVHYLPDSMRLPASELVQNGRLPEWLGEKMAAHFGLVGNSGMLSTQQLRSIFVEAKPAAEQAATSLRRWLLLLLVLLTMLERWLALRKTTLPTYG